MKFKVLIKLLHQYALYKEILRLLSLDIQYLYTSSGLLKVFLQRIDTFFMLQLKFAALLGHCIDLLLQVTVGFFLVIYIPLRH